MADKPAESELVNKAITSDQKCKSAGDKASVKDEELDQAFIVIDNGSFTIKAGFAGDDSPRTFFPTVVGRPKPQAAKLGLKGLKTSYVGDEAETHRGFLNLKRPIEHGIITDWDAMEDVWRFAIVDELQVDPKGRKIMMSDCALNPKINREKMTQIMFEKFDVSGMYVTNQPRLGVFEHGLVNGIALDCGYGVTQTVPILQGNTEVDAVLTSQLSGNDLTQYLIQLLTERGYSFTTSAEQDDVDEMKRKLCYIAEDYSKEQQTARTSNSLEKVFEIPNGSKITLNSERSKCPECLFQPSIIGKEEIGVHESIYYSILKCPPDEHSTLYENIVLIGGSTLIPGFAERLQKEIRGLAPPGTTVKVRAQGERKYASWIGGSILASLTQFQPMWINKSEYDETGPTIVHKKCD